MRTVLPLPFYAFLHEPCIRFGVAGGPGWSRTCVSLEGASRRCRFPREGVRLIELLACDSFADCTQHELQSFSCGTDAKLSTAFGLCLFL